MRLGGHDRLTNENLSVTSEKLGDGLYRLTTGAGSYDSVIVEFKDPNGELSYHQSKEVGWLKKNGFDVHVIDSIAAGLALFEG